MSSMSLEQLIEEIEVYIDNCKTAGFGGSMVKINREEVLAMIDEIKVQLPREINQSKEIVRTQEARMNKVQEEADKIIENAKNEAKKLIDNNEIVNMATMRAQQIYDEAVAEADAIVREAQENSYNIQAGALQYTQNILGGLEDMYRTMIDQESDYFQAVLEKLRVDHRQVLEDKREIDIQLNSGMRSSRSKEDFEKKAEE